MASGSKMMGHLLMTIFLHNFSTFMVIPAITDVTMSALCPGRDECSLAIYLTGFQQAVVGMGSLVVMPLIGNLSDKYGRKYLLTFPMIFSIIPLGILAYSRSRNFFYLYYVLRTLTAVVCEGSVHCLALAYVADNIPERRRATAFGILSGVASCSFVCGNLSTRFLSTPLTFQVSASVAVLALLYLRVFLPDSAPSADLSAPFVVASSGKVGGDGNPTKSSQIFKTVPSLEDMVALVKSSLTFLQAALVAFFGSLADVGLHASMMYYLKAKFHFNKDQFADLLVISGIAGAISQLLVMPTLVPVLGEARLLSIGLFFNCAHVFLYSIAWAPWVPYVAAMFSVLFVFTHPCMRSIVSKQVGSCEQGKAQGCISGISSFANFISPMVFSPLTALFLSENAPFDFPGFSIMCIGFASMIAFVQSLMIRVAPPISNNEARDCRGLIA
ncbi:hypothetical protein SAY87_003121 [Trapa incisa]|uniref:Major facilitator superfamily (MFS) profile domain-containing protein n=2 Tax=Trapa TaxID=22665 RepID=A0AAN7QXL5_TRANT|nr:hypothetical protein SAY87_003121 [Trapa incisa]KAK4778878.1 hypothetical protein SAY86_006406 [Trapa natans]